MKLYHWSSIFLKQYARGDIVVMAESVNEARKKVRNKAAALIKGKLDKDYNTNHFPCQFEEYKNRHLYKDWLDGGSFIYRIKELKDDLKVDPKVVDMDCIFISGSE